MKNIYPIQPYEVGTRNHKSLAVIIPSQVKKECDINTSSIFYLEVDRKLKRMHLSGPTASINLVNYVDNFHGNVISNNQKETPRNRIRKRRTQ